MRRTDRQLTTRQEILAVLEACKVCRLGFTDAAGPYIVPMNFGYTWEADTLQLYFHSAKEGRKVDYLSRGGTVAFEMDTDHKLYAEDEAIPCTYAYAFASIIGSGAACEVTDGAEKIAALQAIMQHQTGQTFSFGQAQADSVAVFRVTATEFAAKRHL